MSNHIGIMIARSSAVSIAAEVVCSHVDKGVGTTDRCYPEAAVGREDRGAVTAI